MTFDEQRFEVYGFRLHGLSLVRGGPVNLSVRLPAAGQCWPPEPLAMRHSTIRDVWVFSNEQPFAPGFPGYADGAALFLDGLPDCLLENVQVDGCEVGLLLKDSARCTLSSVQACLQMAQGSRHGIVIEGGGGHVLTNSVFGPMGSNTYPGHALTLRNEHAAGTRVDRTATVHFLERSVRRSAHRRRNSNRGRWRAFVYELQPSWAWTGHAQTAWNGTSVQQSGTSTFTVAGPTITRADRTAAWRS